jgi:hypothetical protein
MKLLFLLFLIGTGCGKPANTCGSVTGILVPSGSIDDDFAVKAELGRQVGDAISDSCRDDHWSQDAIDCMVDQRGTGRDITSVLEDCQPKIGSAYTKLDKKLSDLSVDAMAKQLEQARARRATAVSGAH